MKTNLAIPNLQASEPGNWALRLESVSRLFGAVQVLAGLDLEVARGEFVAIVGPSGCGKTTLLNLLSGYDQPSSGRVVRSGTARTVFQQDGLFPWMTARENIEMGLRHVGSGAERARLSSEMLALIGMPDFGEHYPHHLSGGMRQRVEIARALAGESDILLLDEPFSALDYLTRLRLRNELARLLDERPRTVVFVTHDIEEAAHLADRIVVLSERPASVRFELRLDTPRPRDLTGPAVVGAVKRILGEMGLAQDDAPPSASQVTPVKIGTDT